MLRYDSRYTFTVLWTANVGHHGFVNDQSKNARIIYRLHELEDGRLQVATGGRSLAKIRNKISLLTGYLLSLQCILAAGVE